VVLSVGSVTTKTRHSIANLSRCTRAVKWFRPETLAPAFPFSELPALCIIIETSLPRLHSFLPSSRSQATRQPWRRHHSQCALRCTLQTHAKSAHTTENRIELLARHLTTRTAHSLALKGKNTHSPLSATLSPKDVLYTNNPIPIAS
jgi:hypothetical protein